LELIGIDSRTTTGFGIVFVTVVVIDDADDDETDVDDDEEDVNDDADDEVVASDDDAVGELAARGELSGTGGGQQ